MKIFLGFVRLFILKSFRAEKFLAALSVLGIALGIGLFVGIKVSSDRAIASFEADIRGADPSVSHEILSAAGTDFSEKIYPVVRRIAPASYPVLKASAYLPAFREVLDLSGVDSVRAGAALQLQDRSSLDIERFFRTENGVLVTRRFADAHSLKTGDVLQASVYDRSCSLIIAGLLDSPALPRNAAFMDLGNFQEYFGKTGLLTRIDLSVRQGESAGIRSILPHGLVFESKEQLVRNRGSMIKSFRYNLQFVSLIAIMVGIFLLYNTVFITVVKRRTEIGILRALGTTRREVSLLFMTQGLIYGVTGSLLGIVLGQAAAYFAGGAVTRTLSTMYAAVSVSDYLISASDAAWALVLGVAISLAASAIPAHEATRVAPHESAREGSFEGRYRRLYPLFSGFGLFAVCGGCGLAYVDYRAMPFDFPFLAYSGMVAIIVGFALISPLFLSRVLKIAGTAAKRCLSATGQIALGDMRGNLYRFSVALMSVAISCALIIALLTLIFSFRSSLREWINRNISADLYVKPVSCVSNFCFFPLSDEAVRTIRNFPGVAAVDRFRTLSLDFRGRKIVAGFGDVGLRTDQLTLRSEDPDAQARRAALAQSNRVEISTYLATKFGIREGDTITLETPKGLKPFVVAGVFSSYSTTSGFLYMDRRWLREYWGLDDSTQLGVYLTPDADIDQVARRLREALLPSYALSIMNNRELRQDVIRIFDKTFAITYAIEFISILVSLIGVVNTLLALVLEKKREISVLRYLGAGWDQIRSVLVISAGIVGITGIVLGGAMGMIMSVIFIQVVNKISFGWEIRFLVPAGPLSLVALLLFVTTICAGLLPARVARKLDPKQYISFE